MPALKKSIARFTLLKQPNLRDGQETKDFLELVHEFLNEWHLVKLFLRNLPVLDRINIFVLELGARWKFQQRVTFIPPCDYIVGKFCNDGFVKISMDEVLTRERAGQASYFFAHQRSYK
jgi:hypothetical protein